LQTLWIVKISDPGRWKVSTPLVQIVFTQESAKAAKKKAMAARIGKGADDDKAAQEAEAERIAEEVKHVILVV